MTRSTCDMEMCLPADAAYNVDIAGLEFLEAGLETGERRFRVVAGIVALDGLCIITRAVV